nr:MAG TPA: hypothetical protein [Caudoviricetes sp.]
MILSYKIPLIFNFNILGNYLYLKLFQINCRANMQAIFC